MDNKKLLVNLALVTTFLKTNTMENSGEYGAKMPVGQKSSFHHDSPLGRSNAKNNRKTGVQSQGTSVMRKAQYGKSEGAGKASNA